MKWPFRRRQERGPDPATLLEEQARLLAVSADRVTAEAAGLAERERALSRRELRMEEQLERESRELYEQRNALGQLARELEARQERVEALEGVLPGEGADETEAAEGLARERSELAVLRGELDSEREALAQRTQELDAEREALAERARALDERTAEVEALEHRTTDLETRDGEQTERETRLVADELAARRRSDDLDRRERRLAEREDELHAREARLLADELSIRRRTDELDQQRTAEPERRAPMRTAGDLASCLLFVPTSEGYRLMALEASPPAAGERVEIEGTAFDVVRLGPSPLPDDERRCVYLAA